MTSPERRRFTLSWHDELGYRVSVPTLLKHGESLEVMPVSEHEALREAAQAVVDAIPVLVSPARKDAFWASVDALRAVLASADSEDREETP